MSAPATVGYLEELNPWACATCHCTELPLDWMHPEVPLPSTSGFLYKDLGQGKGRECLRVLHEKLCSNRLDPTIHCLLQDGKLYYTPKSAGWSAFVNTFPNLPFVINC